VNMISWVARYQGMPRTVMDDAGSMMRKLFPYKVKIDNAILKSNYDDIKEWLYELLGDDEFIWGFNSFHFKDETIAMQFKLAWRYE
jgi:hypothetical protein